MHVALIGYGEVGRILAEDLRAADHAVVAFDVKLGSKAGIPIRAHALVHGVRLADSHAEAVRSAVFTVSAVTASQTVAAAQACAGALADGGHFRTFCSASPVSRIAAAEHISRGVGRYVVGAVSSSVPSPLIKCPSFLLGLHA